MINFGHTCLIGKKPKKDREKEMTSKEIQAWAQNEYNSIVNDDTLSMGEKVSKTMLLNIEINNKIGLAIIAGYGSRA